MNMCLEYSRSHSSQTTKIKYKRVKVTAGTLKFSLLWKNNFEKVKTEPNYWGEQDCRRISEEKAELKHYSVLAMAVQVRCQDVGLVPETSHRPSHRAVSPVPHPAVPAGSGTGRGKAGMSQSQARMCFEGWGEGQGLQAVAWAPLSYVGSAWSRQPWPTSKGLWGCGPAPTALTSLGCESSGLLQPLSHIFPDPCVSCPSCPSCLVPATQPSWAPSLLLQALAGSTQILMCWASCCECWGWENRKKMSLKSSCIAWGAANPGDALAPGGDGAEQTPRLCQGSVSLSACQHWRFWSSAKILLALFGLCCPAEQHWLWHQQPGELPVELRRGRRKKINNKALWAGQWNGSAEEMLPHPCQRTSCDCCSPMWWTTEARPCFLHSLCTCSQMWCSSCQEAQEGFTFCKYIYEFGWFLTSCFCECLSKTLLGNVAPWLHLSPVTKRWSLCSNLHWHWC